MAALAVGYFVDDRRFANENINENIPMKTPQPSWMAHNRLPPRRWFSTLAFVIVFVPFCFSPFGEVSVHTAGDGRGFRDAHVLPAFAPPSYQR